MKITQYSLFFIIAYSSFLYSAESNSAIVKDFDLANCVELSFFGTKKILAITKDDQKSNGYVISLKKNTIQKIFSNDNDNDPYVNYYCL